MTRRSLVAALCLSLMLPAGPSFAEAIGNAVRIVNKVTGSLDQLAARSPSAMA